MTSHNRDDSNYDDEEVEVIDFFNNPSRIGAVSQKEADVSVVSSSQSDVSSNHGGFFSKFKRGVGKAASSARNSFLHLTGKKEGENELEQLGISSSLEVKVSLIKRFQDCAKGSKCVDAPTFVIDCVNHGQRY